MPLVQIQIQKITWQQAIPVRHKVLWPDKSPEFCHVEGDKEGWHFGAFLGDQLVAVASIYFDGCSARLRKFATLVEYQGQGIGKALLTEVIGVLRTEGIKLFWCDARESAMGFYQPFGMQAEGERFYKGPVPYFKMSLSLQ